MNSSCVYCISAMMFCLKKNSTPHCVKGIIVFAGRRKKQGNIPLWLCYNMKQKKQIVSDYFLHNQDEFIRYFSVNTHKKLIEQKIFLKVAWIQSHQLHLQLKFKLWPGKFAWGVKAKHFEQKVCWHHPAMFCLITLNLLPIIWIFTEGEGDGIKFRLSS